MKKYLTLLLFVVMGSSAVWLGLHMNESAKQNQTLALNFNTHPILYLSSGLERFLRPAFTIQVISQTASGSLQMSQFAHNAYQLLIAFFIFSGHDIWHSLSQSPVGRVLVADIKGGVSLKSYTGDKDVPEWFLRTMVRLYLRYGDYDAQGNLEGSKLPLFNFALFGYNLSISDYNERVFEVSQILLTRGANINALDASTGRTALHEAIFMNYAKVVEFLTKNNADPNIRVNNSRSFFNNADALAFALKCEKMDKNMNYSEVIWLVRRHQREYSATKPRALQAK